MLNPSEFEIVPPGRIRRHCSGKWFFVPFKLPPPVELHWDLVTRLSTADYELGRLAGWAQGSSSARLFLRLFLFREAHCSASLSDDRECSLECLFRASLDPPRAGARERVALNIAETLDYALRRVQETPLRVKTYEELHARLFQGIAGATRPGHFRRSDNWGRSTAPDGVEPLNLPPPADEAASAFRDFDHYVHSDYDVPDIVRLALLHFQFAAISPFAEGNGRLGRLLLPVFMRMAELLPLPFLCFSSYFSANRELYRQLMMDVTLHARWVPWIEFFGNGITAESIDSISRLLRLSALLEEYRKKVPANRRGKRDAGSPADLLFAYPVLTLAKAAGHWRVGEQEAHQRLAALTAAGILTPAQLRGGEEYFSAREILQTMEQAGGYAVSSGTSTHARVRQDSMPFSAN